MDRFETISLARRDGVAILTLDRPQRLNAISAQMARELPLAWAAIDGDPEVEAVVVTGAGERALCSGFDVAEIAGDQVGPLEPLRFTALHNRCWKPVITAVNGLACGGGLHFVADSDLVLCAEHATFFDSHVSVGLVAGLEPIGLARRIALEPVLRMALVGRAERMDAARALRLGLVGEVVARERLLPRALELAAAIRGAPAAELAAAKRALWHSILGESP